MTRYGRNIAVIALLLSIQLFIFNYWLDFVWWGNVFLIIGALFAIGTNVVAIWHARKYNYDISDNNYMKGI
ncbi:hypothetical protein ACFOU0_01090 [Salinicoccus sesuvii]|uniref:Uncharacterized protein n=1 Tax=Salinicoccus sesuvii TaxID=868281 RepID=A0ABV7N2V4_9STAP